MHERFHRIPYYLLVDVDERPLYAGKSRRVRSRLLQHFIGQHRSATADGLLGIYDVLRVYVWYCSEADTYSIEAALLAKFNPRWNRALAPWPGELPEVEPSRADASIGILDSPEQLVVRRDPLERAENKVLHLLRAIRKARISGASPAIRMALVRHADELVEHLKCD